jgi:uncharacterized protein
MSFEGTPRRLLVGLLGTLRAGRVLGGYAARLVSAREKAMTEGVPERSDWLLLLLSRDVLGVEGPDYLDPVRIQKGMFLLSERGPAPGAYSFRPYNWGPFSPAIYADVDSLVQDGLVRAEPVPGQSWHRYYTTAQGEARARHMAERIGESNVEWLAQTRRFLTTRGFARLLKDLYDQYPDYATRSQLRR